MVSCSYDKKTQKKDLFDIKKDESEIVENYFNNFAQKSLGTEVKLSKLKDIYPVFYFSSIKLELISEFENKKTLKSIIGEKYSWICVTETNQVLTINYREGEYKLDKVRVSGPITGYDYIVDKEVVINEITNAKITDISEVFIVSDDFYPLTMVVIESNLGEYVVPFCARPDLSKLENGKIYTAKEAMDILSEWYCS